MQSSLSQPIIDVKNLSKSYLIGGKPQPVLKNLQLSIQRKSITGIIGKSGAGKSTLLRCFNLLEKPETGQILINDLDIVQSSLSEIKTVRQKIGMIFQSFHLLNNRSVKGNISLPLEILKKDKNEINALVNQAAHWVGLKEKLESYPSQLSGGQKQRVAIARALVTQPDILLCDEFTSALDPETALEILSLIRKINSDLGVTIVLITHDMAVVREICDSVYVLHHGEIVESGPVETVFYSPKHSITQSLIHSMVLKDIPDALKERLKDQPSVGCQILAQLFFSSTSSQKPILSNLIHELGIPVNIIAGHLDHIRKTTLGNLLISLDYHPETCNKVKAYLEKYHVQFESLGYLV